jgi:hypothetical protein
VNREAPVHAYGIVIAVLLLSPWVLVGVVLIGSMALAAGCWLRRHGWPSWAHECGKSRHA